MPKNRDYTGLEVTPSSMAWLIDQRARVRGELDLYKTRQATSPEKIRLLEAELECLDEVFPLHQVKVDPEKIVGKRTNRPGLVPRGEFKRSLVRALKAANGRQVSTTDLVMQCLHSRDGDFSQAEKSSLLDRAGRCLRKLSSKGLVCRHHSKYASGSWSWVVREERP